MFKYETHLHTAPVSRCASASVVETIDFYKSRGYDGIFITNHFLDGNINIHHDAPFRDKLNFYFLDYEEAVSYGNVVGLKVFLGVETSFWGTDFLVYGLDKEWYAAHPEFLDMKRSKALELLHESGAFLIQAHPYRDSPYIDHVRLYPRVTDGVEVINASRPDFENQMADLYATHYGFVKTAGSDNHSASRAKRLGGVMCEEPINSVEDYIRFLKEGKLTTFCEDCSAE